MSASAGVVKLVSAWYQGHPGRMEPFDAFRAWVSEPSDPETTSVWPSRLPMAKPPITAVYGVLSVPGFWTFVNHSVPTLGLIPMYPPPVGSAAFPTPT